MGTKNGDRFHEKLAEHDKKLALDYMAIQTLTKDTDDMSKSVTSLTTTVAGLAGVVETQSKIVNAVLAVTVIAFLGVVVKTSVEATTKPDSSAVAKEFVTLMQKEIQSQRLVESQVSEAHRRVKK